MLNFLLEPFGQAYIQKSGLEMLLIALVCGVVSSYIILRGVAFLANALSHAIFPGIIVAYVVGSNIFWGGLVAGLIVVVVISLVGQNEQVSENSAVGVLYIGAFALGVVLLSTIKRSSAGGVESFLFGQLFGVGWGDILNTAIVGTAVLTAIFLARKELLLTSFDTQMARAMGLPVNWLNLGFLVLVVLTVVTGLPAVGNILMIALVITPGATARLLTERLGTMIILAIGTVIVASTGGIVFSYHIGLAPGSCVVVALTLVFLIALTFSIIRKSLTTTATLRLAASPENVG